MVLKSGVIAWAQVWLFRCRINMVLELVPQMGDANASIPTVQPVYGRPMWGSHAASAALNSVSFVSQISITSGIVKAYGLKKGFEAVKNCRNISKKDMKWNKATPHMKVDPESYEVYADKVHMDVGPAERLPLSRYYNLF